MKTTSILIRSFADDAAWLEYCLRSIKKFCSGFAEVVVIVPEYDRNLFCQLDGTKLNGLPVRVRTYPGNRPKPMLECMESLCHSEEWCPHSDLILHTDSDCIFSTPVTPETFMTGGKPDLLVRSFDSLRGQGAYCWREGVENCFKAPATHETMVRHPSVHYRGLYPSFRAQVEGLHGMSFHDWATRGPEVFPWPWSEFCCLGAWALKSMPRDYNFIDVSGVPEEEITKKYKTHLMQGWSRGDMNDSFQRSQANEQRRKFYEILK